MVTHGRMGLPHITSRIILILSIQYVFAQNRGEIFPSLVLSEPSLEDLTKYEHGFFFKCK